MQSVSITQFKMKVLESVILSFLIVALFTTSIAEAKKNSSSSTVCNDNKTIPMSALGCCPMPQFVSEDIIKQCRMNAAPGNPQTFFDNLLTLTTMGTNKNGKVVVDKAAALKYLQAQLNDTTKSDWTKPVANGVTKSYEAYTNDNSNTKTFLDSLIKEFYIVSYDKSLS